MAKTIEVPTGQVCEDCEDYDQNFDEATESYPLATVVLDFYGYEPIRFACKDCEEARWESFWLS
jgi:hypothetical protein